MLVRGVADALVRWTVFGEEKYLILMLVRGVADAHVRWTVFGEAKYLILMLVIGVADAHVRWTVLKMSDRFGWISKCVPNYFWF